MTSHPPSDQPSDQNPDAASLDIELIDVARSARERAYAPYSKFKMGAAVRTYNDEIIPGALIENVSLGLAMCAERVALFGTVTTGHRPVRLALVSPRTSGELTHPCGACLQVALELGGPTVEVIVVDPDGESATSTVGELLPCGPHRS